RHRRARARRPPRRPRRPPHATMTAGRDVVVHPTVDALMRAAADEIAGAAAKAVRDTGRFAIALSGGSTPRRLYEVLAREPYATSIAWRGTDAFFGDERCVPP